MVAAYVVILSSPFWTIPLAGYFLRTAFYVPSGAIIWTFVACMALLIACATVAAFAHSARYMRERRALKLRPPQEDEMDGQLAPSNLPTWPFAIVAITIKLVIPALLALDLMHQNNASPMLLIERNGKLIYPTREENLEFLLQALQKDQSHNE